ncbi:MAG: carboxymuconolactone decarboxylase family protein [Chitinophagaceae bacterium]|nr:carboxymuconolactone decarboxylase family protein [Rubrivivax sp.]
MTRILNRWPPDARAVAARVALTFSLAAASVHAAPAAPAGGGTGESARVDRGLQVLSELNGGGQQPVFEAMRRDFPFLAEATAGYALGDVWGRQVLDAKTRQLAAMAAFGAMGLRPFFKIHAGYALNAGASADELKEIVYLLTVPAGFPRAIDASQALQELFVERSTANRVGQP